MSIKDGDLVQGGVRSPSLGPAPSVWKVSFSFKTTFLLVWLVRCAGCLSLNSFWWQDQRPLGTSLGCVETPEPGSPHLTRQTWKDVEKINLKKSKCALVLVKNYWVKKVKLKTRSSEHIRVVQFYSKSLHSAKASCRWSSEPNFPSCCG